MKPNIKVALFDSPSNRKNDKSTEIKKIDWDEVGQKAAIAQEIAVIAAKAKIK
jgi:hypothetical protein